MKDNLLDREISSAPMWLRVTALTIFAASIAINVFFGIWGPHSTAQVSDSFHLFVTPPKWTFIGIWSTIYVLYSLALIYVAINDKWPSKAYWTSIVASILNSAWLAIFSYGTKTSNIICFIIIFALFVTLYTLWKFTHDPPNTDWVSLAVRNIISLYFGWVLVATVLSFGVLLVYYAGLSHRAFLIIFWVLTPLLFIGITVWTYIRDKGYGVKGLIGFWIAGLWAFTGALVSTLENKHFL